MQQWMWRHFGMLLPDDWEMLRFSKASDVGHCQFADRYQFRLEFNWRVVEGKPDFDRMMTDYVSKLKTQDDMEDAREIRSASWRGISGHVGPQLTTRFGRYVEDESCLVEIVFLWPGERDRSLEKHILRSFAPTELVDGSYWRWNAYGMDMLVRDGLELDSCRVEPANVWMEFGSAESGLRHERFARMGMVENWLEGAVAQWIEIQTPAHARTDALDKNDFERFGHRINTLAGPWRDKRVSRLIGRKRTYHAAAWICPDDQRLYFVSCLCPEKDGLKAAELPARRLACCRDLALTL